MNSGSILVWLYRWILRVTTVKRQLSAPQVLTIERRQYFFAVFHYEASLYPKIRFKSYSSRCVQVQLTHWARWLLAVCSIAVEDGIDFTLLFARYSFHCARPNRIFHNLFGVNELLKGGDWLPTQAGISSLDGDGESLLTLTSSTS